MKFKATKAGFFGGSRIRPGQIFDADKFEGSWAVPVVEEKGKGAAAAAPAPVAEPTKPAKKKRRKKTSKKKSSPSDTPTTASPKS